MDLWCIVLSLTVSLVTASNDPVPHEDPLQDPAVQRNCIKADCPCGTEPKICDVEDGNAYCVPCEEGKFQAKHVSTVTIINVHLCKAHRLCYKGR